MPRWHMPWTSWRWDLGLTTRQLLSALDDVALASRTRAQRLADTLERGLSISADAAARRTAAVGRRPYLSARIGPEGLLGSCPPPYVPQARLRNSAA